MRATTLVLFLTALSVLTVLSSPAWAGDVEVQIPVGDGFVVKDNTGAVERLRVDEATGNISRNGALFIHTTGVDATFVGEGAGNTGIAFGQGNSSFGRNALTSVTFGQANSAFGKDALRDNSLGIYNSAFGFRSLFQNIEGNVNSAVGSRALYRISTGDRNTAIGVSAGSYQTIGDDNIYIGHRGVAGESDRIYIGNSLVHVAATIAGIFGGIHAGSIPVLVDSTGRLGTSTSSVRFKEDVEDIGVTSELLMQMRPVTFRYREDAGGDGQTQEYGLIAEEVAEIAPELVVNDDEGQPFSVRYHLLAPLLLNEVQKQQRTIETLLARVHELERQVSPEATAAGE